MYSPGYGITIPPMVSTYTWQVGWMNESYSASAAASGTAVAATVYYPILLGAPCVVRRVWWVNGATTTGGATIEVGVYANSGYGPAAKLIAGSATQGTASQVQFVDVTDTALSPGLYWIALAASTGTNTTLFRCTVGSTANDAAIRFSEAVTTLPATATPVEGSALDIWLCGFATTASP